MNMSGGPAEPKQTLKNNAGFSCDAQRMNLTGFDQNCGRKADMAAWSWRCRDWGSRGIGGRYWR